MWGRTPRPSLPMAALIQRCCTPPASQSAVLTNTGDPCSSTHLGKPPPRCCCCCCCCCAPVPAVFGGPRWRSGVLKLQRERGLSRPPAGAENTKRARPDLHSLATDDRASRYAQHASACLRGHRAVAGTQLRMGTCAACVQARAAQQQALAACLAGPGVAWAPECLPARMCCLRAATPSAGSCMLNPCFSALPQVLWPSAL